MGSYKYKNYMKNVMYLAAKAKLSFLPSIANEIKNDITSSETHIYKGS